MSKPITTPFTFQAQAGPIPLSQLDNDFATAAAAINDFATYSNYLTDTSGAPNQITVTIPVGTTFSYSAGVKLEVLLGNTTTSTAVQINVSGLGNKAVQNIDGSVPAVGQLIAGMILQLQYNGTVFLLTGAASKPVSIAPFIVGAGVQLGAPTGGDQGAGTLNLAGGVFDNGGRILYGSPSSASTTAVIADVGKTILAAGNIAINNAVFSQGHWLQIYNNTAGAITINGTITTMRLAASATTGNRSLVARGMAYIWFVGASECVVSGPGVA